MHFLMGLLIHFEFNEKKKFKGPLVINSRRGLIIVQLLILKVRVIG